MSKKYLNRLARMILDESEVALVICGEGQSPDSIGVKGGFHQAVGMIAVLIQEVANDVNVPVEDILKVLSLGIKRAEYENAEDKDAINSLLSDVEIEELS